jgi:Ca2+-binding EF-hand superfamily protein
MGPNGRASTANNGSSSARIRSPWDQESGEVIDDFYRNLEAVNVEVSRPWDITESDILEMEKQKAHASNYKYESLFEVPEMSDQRKRQLAEYHINPPFNCGYNEIEEKKRPPRRQDTTKSLKTKDPWAWGAEAGEPVHRKIHEKPSTALWDVPKGDQSGNKKAVMVSSGDPILDSLRSQLFAHGAAGIQGLARKFRIMDDDGSGTLDLNEFRKGMKECGIVELSDRATNHLFRYFDKDDTGTITYDEFLVGVRGVMNSRRKQIVEMAFWVLDTDGSGVVDIDDVKTTYDVRSHPDVIAGRLTPEEALLDFLDTFRIASKRGKNNRPPTGGITLDDFCDYYANISASVDSDDYFELMIRNAWHISGGTGWCENTTNRRLLVTHADGRQSVQEIQNDIGIRAKDTDKMMAKLQAQGISDVKNINLTGIEDMKHQVENPQYRAALQRQLDEENRQIWLQEQQQQQQLQSQSQQLPQLQNIMPRGTSSNGNLRVTPPVSGRGGAPSATTMSTLSAQPVSTGQYNRSASGVNAAATTERGSIGAMSHLANVAAAGAANSNVYGARGGSGVMSTKGGIPPPVSLAKIISGR